MVQESFTLRLPDNLPLDATAPLLCAGITVYRFVVPSSGFWVASVLLHARRIQHDHVQLWLLRT